MSDIQAIKYRLVGAVVIVLGFACMWWLMLDHEAHRRIKNEQVDIPPQTLTVERFDIEQPKPLNIRPEDADTAVKPVAAVVEKNKDTSSEEIKPAEVKATVLSPPEAEKEIKQEQKIVEKKVVEQKLIEPKPVAQKTAPAAVPIASKTNNYAALEANGLPEAWVLQLASLKSKENAQQLQKKLLASKYPAYIKSVTKADGVSYRVLVGPKLSHDKAVEMAKAIEKELGIKSMIVKFQTGYEQ